MNKHFLLIIAILICWQSNAQIKTNKIIIHFEGKKYDNLDMVVKLYNGELDSNRETIHGKTKNGKTWSFVYNDSIYNNYTYVAFQRTNEKQTELEYIGFNRIINNDTLFAGGVSFSKGTSEVLIKYFKTKTIVNSSYFDEETKTQVKRKITQAHYLVNSDSDPALLSSIEAIGLKYCLFPNTGESEYKAQLEKYINMTKKYPKSRYFAWLLSNNVSTLKSKEDIHEIYNCFDLELKKSIFGEKINDFLISSNTVFEFDKFENFFLPSSVSSKPEPIIKDTSTYNLVIFSASWCSPCHKQIPLLKEIYKNLNLTLFFCQALQLHFSLLILSRYQGQ